MSLDSTPQSQKIQEAAAETETPNEAATAFAEDTPEPTTEAAAEPATAPGATPPGVTPPNFSASAGDEAIMDAPSAAPAPAVTAAAPETNKFDENGVPNEEAAADIELEGSEATAGAAAPDQDAHVQALRAEEKKKAETKLQAEPQQTADDRLALENARNSRLRKPVAAFRAYELSATENDLPEATSTKPLKNFTMTNWAPINYNSMRMIALWYGGPEQDPNFLDELDKLAASQNMTPEQLVNHREKLKFDQFKTEKGEAPEMDPQDAIFALFQTHSALMRHTHGESPYRLVEVGLRKKGIVSKFKTHLSSEGQDNNDQHRFGADILYRDARQNAYWDNGRSVRAYLTRGESFGAPHALNLAAIHIAHRLKPTAPGVQQPIRVCINTHKSTLLNKQSGKHAYFRDLTILAALHEGVQANVIPEISVQAFGMEKPVGKLSIDKMNQAAVAEMRMAGINVDALIDLHNNRSLGVLAGPSIEGEQAEPGASVKRDADKAKAAAAAAAVQAETPQTDVKTGVSLTAQTLATKPVAEILSNLAGGDSDYIPRTADLQAALMVKADKIKNDAPYLDNEGVKRKLEDFITPERAEDVVKEAKETAADAFQAHRATVDAGKGIGEAYGSKGYDIPPFMTLMGTLVEADHRTNPDIKPEAFKTYKDAALMAQAAARIEQVLDKPEVPVTPMRISPADPQPLQDAVKSLDELAARDKSTPLDTDTLAQARQVVTATRDAARSRLLEQGFTDAAQRLDKAFEPQEAAPAAVAPATAVAEQTTAPEEQAPTQQENAVRETPVQDKPVTVATADIPPASTPIRLKSDPASVLKSNGAKANGHSHAPAVTPTDGQQPLPPAVPRLRPQTPQIPG